MDKKFHSYRKYLKYKKKYLKLRSLIGGVRFMNFINEANEKVSQLFGKKVIITLTSNKFIYGTTEELFVNAVPPLTLDNPHSEVTLEFQFQMYFTQLTGLPELDFIIKELYLSNIFNEKKRCTEFIREVDGFQKIKLSDNKEVDKIAVSNRLISSEPLHSFLKPWVGEKMLEGINPDYVWLNKKYQSILETKLTEIITYLKKNQHINNFDKIYRIDELKYQPELYATLFLILIILEIFSLFGITPPRGLDFKILLFRYHIPEDGSLNYEEELTNIIDKIPEISKKIHQISVE